MKNSSILIIGSGGREHALGWKLRQSPQIGQIYFAPGNAGTSIIGQNVAIGVGEIRKLLNFAKKNSISLTVVGPEAPLAAGIVDIFEKNKLAVFGPVKKAARLETSKAWAVKFMQRHNIPHPKSYIFSNADEATEFLSTHDGETVIKADGLAAGKGVIIPHSKVEALKAIRRIMVEKEFGSAGSKVIIQEKITGEEVSILALSDGETITPLMPAQDHKRIFDGDQGPNTGGMGAYSPVPIVNKALMNTIRKKILQPTIDGMCKEGIPYKGILYAGLMIADGHPYVIEYNARFGDPETQAILMLLKSDLYPVFMSCIKGNLKKTKIIFKKGATVCIVLASNGYPGKFEKGLPIHGLQNADSAATDIEVFHSGTAMKGEQVVTASGRVLSISAFGTTMKVALKKAYDFINRKKVYFKDMHYRRDIGRKTYV